MAIAPHPVFTMNFRPFGWCSGLACAVSRQDTRALYCCNQAAVLWDYREQRALRDIKLEWPESAIEHRSGSWVAGARGEALYLEPETLQTVATIAQPTQRTIATAILNPDACADYDLLITWSTGLASYSDTRQAAHIPSAQHDEFLGGCTIDRDVVACGAARSVHILDFREGKIVKSVETEDAESVSWDGSDRLASVQRTGHLRVYDVRHMSQVLHEARPSSYLQCVKYLPDKSLVCSGAQGCCKVYNQTLDEVLASWGNDDSMVVRDVTFSPEATLAFCTSFLGVVRCWDMSQFGGAQAVVDDPDDATGQVLTAVQPEVVHRDDDVARLPPGFD
eukprot:NODE_1922_length_1181_cov_67.553131_g1906_i0.p1 GENE.NODE_1922_length_1181_cov_67.553131_g1906_i0~~NODE_1922_length_1181_cov_67.553131_g1906_i0.p1  ORF type:complete len:335 (-),score=70.01 NODE_1922_length_1181_cov_67.553131_g1906_i0:64-1068(-)